MTLTSILATMSKKSKNTPKATVKKQSAIVTKLLADGKITLKATNREEMSDLFAKVASECAGHRLAAGAVSTTRDGDGCILKIEIV